MARPKKAITRPNRAYVRLSDDEYASIQDKAQSLGLGLSEYIRRTSLAGEITITEQTSNPNDEIVFQLCKIGNNLNQTVKSGHKTGYVSPAVIEETIATINQINRKLFIDSPTD